MASIMHRTPTGKLGIEAIGQRRDDVSATCFFERGFDLFLRGSGIGVEKVLADSHGEHDGLLCDVPDDMLQKRRVGRGATHAKHSRRNVRLTVLNSCLPKNTQPDDGSYMRRIRDMVVLLPPPLLPMIHENFLAGKVQLKRLKTGMPGLDG